ncbi:MAG: ISL3 family transposase [Gammaproteobacteria bacterium]
MLLTRLLNACHHFPGFVYERAHLRQDLNTIEVKVRPRHGGKARCSGCQRPAAGYDRLDERRFEFIPLWGYAVVLVYGMRRVQCRDCGVRVEQVPWGLEQRTLASIRAIGVDEIQYGRGHQSLTLVYQIEAHCIRLLWVGEARTIESFERFFTLIGQEIAERIEFICSDMWKPYLDLIAKHCSQALNILDRFHVVTKMNKTIDEVRAGEARQLVRDGYEPVLKKTRWCLLKRKQNLTDTQRIRLSDILRYNLKSVRAYLLKEDFQQFWDYTSPTWAGKFLDEWCYQVMRSRIEPMKKFARTLRNHRELLLNYFRARKQFSSGVIEGLNNKAKVTMRKSYGFRTFRIAELALYHTLGKLPEPLLAHRFF